MAVAIQITVRVTFALILKFSLYCNVCKLVVFMEVKLSFVLKIVTLCIVLCLLTNLKFFF